MNTFLLALLAYLMGSFPSGLVLTRLLRGQDIRRHGSGNIGAANVSSTAGWRIGVGVGLVDVLKGVAPILMGRWLGLGENGLALVALVAVLGHDFSLLVRFQGGKGVATTMGAALALQPIAAVLAMGAWLTTWLIWRYASLASLVALAVLPIIMALVGAASVVVVLTIILFLLGVAKHWENIVRLAQGREPRAGERRPPEEEM